MNILYAGLAVVLPVAYLAFPSTKVQHGLRPRWLHPELFLRLTRLPPLALVVAAESCLVAVVFAPQLVALRLSAALSFSMYALHHHATVGTHFESLPAMALWVAVLPQPSLSAWASDLDPVLLLRVLIASHIGSAGVVTKLTCVRLIHFG